MAVTGAFQPPRLVIPSPLHRYYTRAPSYSCGSAIRRRIENGRSTALVLASNEAVSSSFVSDSVRSEEETEREGGDQDQRDMEYVSQIKRVLELLKKNRDMMFDEVKLTLMIEDPRDVERRRLLGIDDENAPTRDDLADALVQVNEGQIPDNRAALRMLAEEMIQWPNLEVETSKKRKPSKSQYASVTNTGVDPQEVAQRLKIDWDSATEIEDSAEDETDALPPAVGYGALYLVTAFPVIIGVSIVLILFYNSLQ